MNYKQHALSAVFPPMGDEEFAALVADIAANGQREPAVIFEREVIDGWHRTRACDQLGIEVMTRPLEPGIDPVAYVLSRNLHRRHLTASQRAMAVAACAKWLPVGRPANSATIAQLPDAPPAGRSIEQLADDAGVSRRTMQHAAKVVKEAAPEVAKAVTAGTLPVAQAAEIAAMPQDEQAAAISAPPKQRKPKPEQAPPADAGALKALQAQLKEVADELTATLGELTTAIADRDGMAKVFEADEKLTEALKQNKQLRAEVSGLRERINGLMGEKNEGIRLVKHWKGRAERAEKAGAAA